MVRNVAVVIPAGGRGRRMGQALPKQFLPLGGIPILQRTVALFDALPEVGEIVIVVPRGYRSRVERMAARACLKSRWSVVAGGKERQDSVWNGLRSLRGAPAYVLVHDAVRPLASRRVIRDVIRAAAEDGAAVAAVPVKDTVKVEGRKGFFAATLKRERLWVVQTPQGFRKELLLDAHRRARRGKFIGTDESSLVERIGLPVRIVRGEERNLKITTVEDLLLARILAKRVGKR